MSFEYILNPEQIAQEPLSTRSASRLLEVDFSGGKRDRLFSDLPTILDKPSGENKLRELDNWLIKVGKDKAKEMAMSTRGMSNRGLGQMVSISGDGVLAVLIPG